MSALRLLPRQCSFPAYSFAKWPALSDSHGVTLVHTESWRNMCCQVLVSLLVTGVFLDEVEVFTADDERSVHFGRDDRSSQNPTADRHETGERALFVYRP